jgi:hypothetical protein
MSQQWVESILGRLITDAVFRERFFIEPVFVCKDHAFELTPTELSALLRVDGRQLDTVTSGLDPRIVRAPMSSPRATTRGRSPRRRRPSERRKATASAVSRDGASRGSDADVQ